VTEIGSAAAEAVISLPGTGDAQIALSWAAISHVGLKRTANEDSFVVGVPVFAVADGMGGHLAGDRASDAVVSRLAEISGNVTDVMAVENALRLATEDIDTVANGSDIGVGTTVTGAILSNEPDAPHFRVFNIGDSRVYRFQGGKLDQVTIDHSLVQEMVDAGQITPEQAISHPQGNVITRAVGFGATPSPDSWLVPAVPGLRLLLCSDGLTGEVRDEKISAILAAGKAPHATAVDLVNEALAHGARDNVTVVVIDTVAVSAGASRPTEGDTLP
jgi:protein phosphatase